VAQRVGRGIALLFLDRSTRRGWVVSITPRPHFTPGKDPVPILQEAGLAPGPVWTGRKSRPHRDSIPDRPARSQSLYRLSYTAHLVKRTVWNSAKDHMILLNHAKIVNPFCSPLEGPGICSHDYPSAAYSEGTARTWQNLMRVQIIFQSTLNWPNEIPNMSETWWKVIILFLKISSLTLSSPSSVFAYGWPHHYWIWKATKELCLPAKSYCQQLGTFCSIFPSLVQSLIQTPNSHMCFNLIPNRKWLSTLCLHLVVKFVLRAVLSFCGQPRNYLIAPCICIFTNKT
jgi:hypothetical protein